MNQPAPLRTATNGEDAFATLDKLPGDVVEYISDKLDACDLACLRATCRAIRALIKPMVIPAGSACSSVERLLWSVDDGGLRPAPPVLLAALSCPCSTKEAIMLCAAIVTHASKEDKSTLVPALHKALCVIAYRWCDHAVLADFVRDCWEAGGVTVADLSLGAKDKPALRLCISVCTARHPEAQRGWVLSWLCRQNMTDPLSALTAAAYGDCRSGVTAVAEFAEAHGVRVDASRAIALAAAVRARGAGLEIMRRAAGRALVLDMFDPGVSTAVLSMSGTV